MDDPTATDAPAPNPVNRLLVVGLGLALMVIVVLVVSLSSVASDRDDLESRFDELAAEQRAEDEALVVAREFLTAFVNFDHTTIDADFDLIVTYATGEFLQEVDSFNDPAVRQGIRDREVQSRGEIVDLFVQDVADGRARLFAVIDQTIQNNEPRLTNDELRMEVGLVREDGVWKVFDVALLQAQGTVGSGDLATPITTPPTTGTTTTTTG